MAGRKRWILFPPSEVRHPLLPTSSPPALTGPHPPRQTPKLQDKWKRTLVQDVTGKHATIDVEKYPGAADAQQLVVVQEAGDIIFVPSGWHHQVENVSDVVASINHNWYNGANIAAVWGFLRSEARAVQEAIADCKEQAGYDEEWEEQVLCRYRGCIDVPHTSHLTPHSSPTSAQCQVVMRANSGINLREVSVPAAPLSRCACPLTRLLLWRIPRWQFCILLTMRGTALAASLEAPCKPSSSVPQTTQVAPRACAHFTPSRDVTTYSLGQVCSCASLARPL